MTSERGAKKKKKNEKNQAWWVWVGKSGTRAQEEECRWEGKKYRNPQSGGTPVTCGTAINFYVTNTTNHKWEEIS